MYFFKFKEAEVTANHDHLRKQLKNLLFEMFGWHDHDSGTTQDHFKRRKKHAEMVNLLWYSQSTKKLHKLFVFLMISVFWSSLNGSLLKVFFSPPLYFSELTNLLFKDSIMFISAEMLLMSSLIDFPKIFKQATVMVQKFKHSLFSFHLYIYFSPSQM